MPRKPSKPPAVVKPAKQIVHRSSRVGPSKQFPVDAVETGHDGIIYYFQMRKDDEVEGHLTLRLRPGLWEWETADDVPIKRGTIPRRPGESRVLVARQAWRLANAEKEPDETNGE